MIRFFFYNQDDLQSDGLVEIGSAANYSAYHRKIFASFDHFNRYFFDHLKNSYSWGYRKQDRLVSFSEEKQEFLGLAVKNNETWQNFAQRIFCHYQHHAEEFFASVENNKWQNSCFVFISDSEGYKYYQLLKKLGKIN